MMYSVWDHATRRYNYFQTQETSHDTQTGTPNHLSGIVGTKRGITPETAAWPLPKNAVRVGAGKYPKGKIAVEQSGVSSLGFVPSIPTSPLEWAAWGIVGFAAYKLVTKGKLF